MKSKIIYHYGSLAGWPFVLSQTFREYGYPSVNVVHDSADYAGTTNSKGASNRQLAFDECLNLQSYGKLRKLFNRVLLTLRILFTGRLVHYHGSTILPYDLDVFLFKLFGIPTVITWGGGDARITSIAVANNPYFYRYVEEDKDRRIRKKLRRLSKYGVSVCTDPEMAMYMRDYFEKVYPFRQPIKLSDLTCNFPDSTNPKPLLMHVPTHPFVKGTVHVRNAIERLNKEGFQFETLILESTLTQKDFRKKLSECDVYIDELRCGTYGYTAVEAAGSGKPTITYIIPDLIKSFPAEFPYISANADSIYDVLKRLVQDGKMRSAIGQNSRSYVEKYHAAEKVVVELLGVYKQCGMN